MPVAPDIEDGGYIQVIPESSERTTRTNLLTTRTTPVEYKPVISVEPSLRAPLTQTTLSATGQKRTINKTVKTVGLLSIIGTGAGLLANGVKSLFDGTLKAKRQEKKAAKAAAKAAKQADATAALKSAAVEALTGQPTIPGQAVGGDFALTSSGGGGQMGNISDFLQKNWMIIAVAALVLFGGKLFKTRRAPRRRSAPRTVTRYRYRTRKPAARRRRR